MAGYKTTDQVWVIEIVVLLSKAESIKNWLDPEVSNSWENEAFLEFGNIVIAEQIYICVLLEKYLDSI